jgi:pyruvate dehydrogenase E2 component (dihydrolipoamide acetyltransferase)
MAREFKLPDLGEGVHEGEIITILVAEGDQVEEDQPILEVETDKAAVEIPSPYEGTVTKIHVSEGDLVRVGDVLITFSDVEGAEEEAEEEAEPQPEPQPKPEEAEEEGTEAEPVKRHEGPVPASPSTRRLARELEVDLRQVPGSGPGGRVTSDDVRAFAERGEEAPEKPTMPPEEEAPEKRPPSVEGISPVRPSAIPVPALPDFGHWGEVERVPLRSVRRATARHMVLAWSQIPHVSHQDVADITDLEAFRRQHQDEIEEQGGSLTLTVFVMKAVIAALKAHPRFNASLDADSEEIILKKYYHIGVAVDTERGLLVPVIRDVDRKSITELSVELKELVVRTRDGEATLEEMQGGTFTITNPGFFGGTAFAPIINYPEVAILGMAQARWQPVVSGEGEEAKIVPRLLLPLVLSFDHRVVDGADAARFTTLLIDILQDPDKLLVRV